MTYNETGSGGVITDGLTPPTVLHPVLTMFVPGEAVYSAAKARRGILEKVIIKVVRTVTNKRTKGANRVIYMDTFNGLWNERDLVRPDEAHALISSHFQRVCDDANHLARC